MPNKVEADKISGRVAVILAALALMAPCAALSAPACSPALDDAALAELGPRLGYGVSSFSVYLGQDDAASLNALSARVAAYRRRAAKITDRCSRDAYVHWLAWYDGEIAQARTELTDHHEAREMNEYRERVRKEAEAARAAHIERLP